MTPQVRDLFEVALPVAEEQFETLWQFPAGRVERIVSHGQQSPPGFWYDQAEDEWVLLLQGTAQLSFADGHVVDLRPGIAVSIPAHCRHRVEATDPVAVTIWLAIFSTPTSCPPTGSCQEPG